MNIKNARFEKVKCPNCGAKVIISPDLMYAKNYCSSCKAEINNREALTSPKPPINCKCNNCYNQFRYEGKHWPY